VLPFLGLGSCVFSFQSNGYAEPAQFNPKIITNTYGDGRYQKHHVSAESCVDHSFFSCIKNSEPIHTMPPSMEMGQLNQPGKNSMDADTTNGVINTYSRVTTLSFISYSSVLCGVEICPLRAGQTSRSTQPLSR